MFGLCFYGLGFPHYYLPTFGYPRIPSYPSESCFNLKPIADAAWRYRRSKFYTGDLFLFPRVSYAYYWDYYPCSVYQRMSDDYFARSWGAMIERLNKPIEWGDLPEIKMPSFPNPFNFANENGQNSEQV